jgi:hypothetical protein
MNEVTNRGFSLKGLGGRIETGTTAILPPFLMSQAT